MWCIRRSRSTWRAGALGELGAQLLPPRPGPKAGDAGRMSHQRHLESDFFLPEPFVLSRPSGGSVGVTPLREGKLPHFNSIQILILSKDTLKITSRMMFNHTSGHPPHCHPHVHTKSTHKINHHTMDVGTLSTRLTVSKHSCLWFLQRTLNTTLHTHSFSILRPGVHPLSRTFPGSPLKSRMFNHQTTKGKYRCSSNSPPRDPTIVVPPSLRFLPQKWHFEPFYVVIYRLHPPHSLRIWASSVCYFPFSWCLTTINAFVYD